MGNIVTTIKRFLSNKNTVTIIGVILGLVVLFIGYNYRVSHAVETIKIPYAKQTITATTKITSDMVGTMEVLRTTVSNSSTLISNMNQVLNTANQYCVSETTNVPKGGFFYTEQVKPCNQIGRNVLSNMPDGYKAISIPVDIQSTYGNSMYPNDYIDIYVRMHSESNLLIFGQFITKLPILDVRDSNGNSLYYGGTGSGAPAVLLFAVPEEYFLLIGKATLLGENIVELIPVPGNAKYSSEVGETSVSSEYLRQEILKYTASIPDEQVPEVF